ncbi:MAG: rod shape-determining protein [Campylobacterota bacterium]
MFSFFRNLFKSSDQIVYIRFTRDKVSFYYYPSDVRYEDEPMLAIKKKGKKETVSAVGKEIKELKEEDTSAIYTPFKPFEMEPENFNHAEKVISYLMKKGATFEGSLVAPRVIIHPNKTYVSEMEEDAYRELAMSAGAREVVVYVGDELQVGEIEGVMDAK